MVKLISLMIGSHVFSSCIGPTTSSTITYPNSNISPRDRVASFAIVDGSLKHYYETKRKDLKLQQHDEFHRVPLLAAHGNDAITSYKFKPQHKQRRVPTRKRETALASSLSLNTDEQTLAFWISSFAVSHIGMSAQRNYFIEKCGNIASSLNLVGTGVILPDYWPGDSYAGNKVFPDETTAGRQLYRLVYTIVSFVTLGSALGCYLALLRNNDGSVVGFDGDVNAISKHQEQFYFWVASVSFGAAFTSLFNASPLSLVPGFQQRDDTGDSKNDISSQSSIQQQQQQKLELPLQRDDLMKLEPKGLTRITRHPLILPVVPWGIATSQLSPQGGSGGENSTANILFFCGLALYAICGCYAQDLRVMRQEGSVGTVFSLPASKAQSSEETPETMSSLQTFFKQTSFVPFGAVLDGRQSLLVIVREVPWLGFIFGCMLGAYTEDFLLNFLFSYSSSAN